MPSGLIHIEHVFDGGWAPDFGAHAAVSIDKDGRVRIPWLMKAQNFEFEADGTPHTIGGAIWLDTGIMESQALVRGLFDFWDLGTSGSPLQHRFIHIGTKIKMDDGDDNFSDIFTGLVADSIPHYSTFENQVIIAQTGSDVPKVSDGNTHEDLPAGTPNFSFSEQHKLRQWAAGVPGAPSTLFYSAQEDPTDWTGEGSGDIAIAPGDGDRITAIASHRDELFVFKGPQKGSIRRISGSAPTGDDPFAVNEFIPTGLGAVGQRTIFRFGNDLGFMWSDGSVHSLNTTERFGDFLETSLSRPLNKWLRGKVTGSALARAAAVTHDSFGVVRISIPINASRTNSTVLSMDYRFDPPRWSSIPIMDNRSHSMALVVEGAHGSVPLVMSGGTGVIFKWDQKTIVVSLLVSIPFAIDTPYLSYVQAPRKSTIYFGGVRISPKSSMDVTFSWVRDGSAQQSETFSQWTGDVLATATLGGTNFTLGTSELAGERTITRSVDLIEGGEFQQIQYKVNNTGLFNDLHLKSILASIKPGSISTEVQA